MIYTLKRIPYRTSKTDSASAAKSALATDEENKQSSRLKSSHLSSPSSSLPPSSPLHPSSSSSDDDNDEEEPKDTETPNFNYRTPTSSPATRVTVTQKAALAPKKSQFSFSGGGKQDTLAFARSDEQSQSQSQSKSRSRAERRLSSLPSRTHNALPSITEKASDANANTNTNTTTLRSKAQRPVTTQTQRPQSQILRSSVQLNDPPTGNPSTLLNRRLSIGKEALSLSRSLNVSSTGNGGPARPNKLKNRLSLLGSNGLVQPPSQEQHNSVGPRRVPIAGITSSASSAPLLHKTQLRVSSAPTTTTTTTTKSGPKRPPQGHRLSASVSSINSTAGGGVGGTNSSIVRPSTSSHLRASIRPSSISEAQKSALPSSSSLSKTSGSNLTRLPGPMRTTATATTTSRLRAPALTSSRRT